MSAILFIGIWLVSVAAAGYVASLKGRFWVGWALSGVFLGPIALLVAAVVPSPRDRCPHCQSLIPLGAPVCSHCGMVLDDPKAEEGVTEPIETNERPYFVPLDIDDELPSAVRRALKAGGTELQGDFMSEYRRRRKSAFVATLLWLLLGWHYAYFGKWGIQILYWLSFGGLLIWALIDLFRISAQTKAVNADIAIDVMKDLKAISGVGNA